jgi:hypothetical protein
MSPEENKALVKRFVEAVINQGRLDMAEVVCPNHTGPIVLFTIRGTRAVRLPLVEYAKHDEKQAQQG